MSPYVTQTHIFFTKPVAVILEFKLQRGISQSRRLYQSLRAYKLRGAAIGIYSEPLDGNTDRHYCVP